MKIINIDHTWLDQGSVEQIHTAPAINLSLLERPVRFYRHGWQSWSLTTWLDPAEPPMPIRAPEFRVKDEDPQYSLSKNHTGAWVAAFEFSDSRILLLGTLDLGGRFELEAASLKGFYEGSQGQWLLALGSEDQVFAKYAQLLSDKYGKTYVASAPRVWCSWYSLYKWINEPAIQHVIKDLGDLPFDVIQIDDGWQVAHGDWNANRKFPSGMTALASRIAATGRKAGLWLAPFMVTRDSAIARDHPDWLLRDRDGRPMPVGITWERNPYALDSSHPGVLEWIEKLIRRVRSWGFDYLKLDFLYAGALPGEYHAGIPREESYRNALRIIRAAAADAYILACGAPILPTLGLADGLRIGPDVAPFWINTPMTVWLNNPNDTSTQNAIRTSLHRLWLSPLIHTDPDVIFFRSRFNDLKDNEKQLLADLGTISRFKATSDLPQWLDHKQKIQLRHYLESTETAGKLSRYVFTIGGRIVDFSHVIPLRTGVNLPVWLARNLGMLKIGLLQALPAVWESRRHLNSFMLTVISFLQTIHLPWLP